MDKIKKQLKEYYNKNAEHRNSTEKQPWKIKLRQRLLDIMKDADLHTLLEIGAGTGQDSLFFMENRLEVTAVDLSESHIKKCREKDIDAHIMDFSNMRFEDSSYDCVYAMNCLLHIPNDEITNVINELRRVTKDGGYMFFCQYGTSGVDCDESIRSNDEKGDRFFSFRSYARFKEIIKGAGLDIIESDSFVVGEDKYNMQYFVLRNHKNSF